MPDFPVTLVSPDGRDYLCYNAVELNDLVMSGYVRKTETQNTQRVPVAENASDGAVKPVKTGPDSRQAARDSK
ncbi:hypothetical protein NONI108955_20780 [Nocardia ninae]|uniref:Uncharacterized protein n=1 Tax=Nocardia ninae NBRC 108245 TaxID=1210091 RepID=A0A511MA61_9NOCA|nr:hypothetical protein [Nocardia ninae]GEM37391.1 hypothetical protein NN4_19100 [Nocardia ninae NBRC 108245]